ncbi:MAG: hypothetical protein JNM27_11840 [Leptospirales bacterium]|nr:hypothetical protein [Leptospirales bacterium]
MANQESPGRLQQIRRVLNESRTILHASLAQTRKDWHILLRATGIFCLLLAIVYGTGVLIVIRISYIREYQNILLNVVAMPFLAYLLGGLLQFFRERTRGQTPDWILLLKGHRHYFRILLYCAIYYAAYRFLIRSAIGMEELSLDLQIRIAVGIPLFIWVVTRVCFAFAFVTEQNIGPKAGIKSSFILTGGRFWRTLLALFPLPVCLAVPGLMIGLLPHWALGVLAILILGAILPVALSMILLSYFWMFDRYRKEPTVVQIAAVR